MRLEAIVIPAGPETVMVGDRAEAIALKILQRRQELHVVCT